MVKKGGEVKDSGKVLKVVSFVLALIAAITCFLPAVNVVSIILAIIGLILGIIAITKSEKKGLARAAIIMSILAICIGLIIDLVVGGLIWALFGGGGGFSYGTPINYTNYSIGQKIPMENISLTIVSADKLKSVKGLSTNGYFLFVTMTIKNNDIVTINWKGDPFTLIDSSGRTFSASSEAESYYPNAVTSSGTQLQPGVPLTAVKIFEIPEDSTGLKLKMIFSGNKNYMGAYVDLGK